jgi:hypothetical protein
MNERHLFDLLLLGSLAAAAVTAMFLMFVAAPYGRHVRKGWGPTMDNRLGWIVMEAPAPLVFALCFMAGEYRNTIAALVFLLMWEAHYIHRSFIYPFGLRGTGKRMPVVIAGTGFLFNALNGYLNGRWLYTFSGGYPNSWLLDTRFVAGLERRIRVCGSAGGNVPLDLLPQLLWRDHRVDWMGDCYLVAGGIGFCPLDGCEPCAPRVQPSPVVS